MQSSIDVYTTFPIAQNHTQSLTYALFCVLCHHTPFLSLLRSNRSADDAGDIQVALL